MAKNSAQKKPEPQANPVTEETQPGVDVDAMALEMARLKTENQELQASVEKLSDGADSANAQELALAQAQIESLKSELATREKAPSGVVEIDTLRAELEKQRKKVDDYDGLAAECEVYRKRLRAYDRVDVPIHQQKPVVLPPGWNNTSLVPGTFYKVELDGLPEETECKALFMGGSVASQPSTVVLYVGDEPPVTLNNFTLTLINVPETLENGERVMHKRIVPLPKR